MKKVQKTTRPFRYDLNQIPYDYTVEVRNRFKGLDVIDIVPDELWTQVSDIVQETGSRPSPRKRREVKSKGEKERYTHLNAEFQRLARRDKKAFKGNNVKKKRKTTQWERLEISSRKLEIPREQKAKRNERDS